MKRIKKSTWLAISLVCLLSVFRVFLSGRLGHVWPNFTPIGAIALCSGMLFTNRKMVFIFPLLVLLVSDIFIQYLYYPSYTDGLLYGGWYWTYGSFLLIVLVGHLFRSTAVSSIVLKSVVVSLLHFVITNFGVWLSGGINVTTGLPYTADFSGLMESYILALPFLKNFFIGTLLYSVITVSLFSLRYFRRSVMA